ncbi:transcriptional activator FtrA [compost metagenome]
MFYQYPKTCLGVSWGYFYAIFGNAEDSRIATRAARNARIAATPSKAALNSKVARYPLESKTSPPTVAPDAIASWIIATIKPPPASVSLGSVFASHVHQPTGAAVATSPHMPSKTVVVAAELPNETSASAITAIRIGITMRVRCRPFFKNASIRKVPARPARPRTSNINDSMETLTCVTVSRKGRRIAKAIDWLKLNYASALRVDELAAKVQMSAPTFHHHFRQLTTMSPCSIKSGCD